MKRLNAPKGWSQLLFAAPTEPWAALRAAVAAGAAGTTATLIAAGLRGRGGGGFLTGAKWQATAAEPASQHYAVANGYESDPAVFTNRLLMEENPQGIVEGLAIAALTVGASEAFIAVRAEYTEAIKRLEAVIANAEREGALGATLLGTGRELIITVRPLQGSSMIGEETVLMKALAGKRGQPEQTPPYPSEVGYLGKPTAVNNVATLAAVPWILTNGAEAFAQIGDTTQPGTVLVQISGSVTNPGVLEVPTGTPLNEIIAAAGGTGMGVYQAAKDAGKLAIGVDSNQNHLQPGTMLTSMLKRVDVAVYNVAMAHKPGLSILGLKEGGVDYALDANNAKLVNADMKKKVDAAKADIISGKIKVADYMADNACKL